MVMLSIDGWELVRCRRESAIKELLGRHIELSAAEEYLEREQFIMQHLHVPQEWIHTAKVTNHLRTCDLSCS
jgi:hypothetical protein